LAAEPFALSADTVAALARMGYRIVPLEVWAPATPQKPSEWPRPIRPCQVARVSAARHVVRASDAAAPAGAAVSP